MFIRSLLFFALRRAARHPAVRRQAAKTAEKVFDAARPSLRKASNRAGRFSRKISDEFQPKNKAASSDSDKSMKNVTPRPD